jgi:hypothetical protein
MEGESVELITWWQLILVGIALGFGHRLAFSVTGFLLYCLLGFPRDETE